MVRSRVPLLLLACLLGPVGCAQEPPPPPRAPVLRSEYRTDDSPTATLPDGRVVSAQYIAEQTVLEQTRHLRRPGFEDRILELGYAVCDALNRGLPMPVVVDRLTAGGTYTAQEAGEYIGSFVLLCPENAGRITESVPR
jgi:hypothetical protein